LKCIEARPHIWASHAWNLFDFAADGRDEGGKNGENQKGLVTFDRKYRKDAFYLYKAAWSAEPFVHLCGKRYIDRENAKTQIKVYSNRPEVTLLVDGTEVATKIGSRVFTFDVEISGEHTIQVRSGELCDAMTVRKVEKANPDYRMVGGEVVNWFDADTHNPNNFSIKDTLGALMAHPKAGAIVGRMMDAAKASRGDVAKATDGNKNLERMMAAMTLQSLLKQAGPAIKPEQIQSLNAALQQIPKN
jgi:beta-galactosidase